MLAKSILVHQRETGKLVLPECALKEVQFLKCGDFLGQATQYLMSKMDGERGVHEVPHDACHLLGKLVFAFVAVQIKKQCILSYQLISSKTLTGSN